MSKTENYMDCEDCRTRTTNSSDGGPILCHFHDSIFKGNLEERRIPTIVLAKRGIYDEITHYALDDSAGGSQHQLETLIGSALDEWYESYQHQTTDRYAFELGPELQWLTKEELSEVPEV